MLGTHSLPLPLTVQPLRHHVYYYDEGKIVYYYTFMTQPKHMS